MEPYKMNTANQFEKSFRLAFENAEIVPSPRVWENVTLNLAAGKSGKYKKWLFFFQLVAAASLLFAASIAVFNALNKQKPETLITETIKEKGKAIPCLFKEAKGIHSTKPQKLDDFILNSTVEPRADIFAREKKIGYDFSFGDDVNLEKPLLKQTLEAFLS